MSRLPAGFLAGILALGFASGALAQATTPATPVDRADRPGGTSSIAPTPGPATSPALPSPTLPAATKANRETATAIKANKKAAKKTKRHAKTSERATPAAPSGQAPAGR